MYPATQTVPVGTTIKFSMSAKTYEVHTATFGPGNPETEPKSYLGDLASHFANDPVFPSQARLPERSAAGRSGGPDPDAPRQRVLEHAAPRRRQGDAAADVERGDVRAHQARTPSTAWSTRS